MSVVFSPMDQGDYDTIDRRWKRNDQFMQHRSVWDLVGLLLVLFVCFICICGIDRTQKLLESCCKLSHLVSEISLS